MDKSIDKFAEYFHEVWVFKVGLNLLFIGKMQVEKLMEFLNDELCHDLKSLIDIKRF